MDVRELMEQARDVVTVKRVYGEPIERDGVLVIPAARLRAGGGGGEGHDDEGAEHGSGGGFGLEARPLGAYVIRDGKVTWRPAVDVNKVVLGAQVTAIVALLTIRRIVLAGQRRGRRRR